MFFVSAAFTAFSQDVYKRQPQAYARYDRIGTDVRPDSAAAAAAIARGDLAGLCAQMKNALEYSSASAATKPICETLRAHGASAALMTGSGAAVLGVFADEAPAPVSYTHLASFCVIGAFRGLFGRKESGAAALPCCSTNWEQLRRFHLYRHFST